MARTTSDEVKAILGRDFDALLNPDIAPYIEIAGLLIDRVEACALADGLPISSGEAKNLEKWVAAHAYAASDQTYSSRSTDGASGSFQGQTGMMLEGTKYGQMALSLDFSGYLAAITKHQSAGAAWGGKTEAEQLSYYNRN